MSEADYFKDILHFSEYQARRILLMKNIAENITATDSNLILKGGTALLLCYNLPRFSTDLDYDGKSFDINIFENIINGAKKSDINVTDIINKKNTDTTKRFMVHYQEDPMKPLKIEVSFRNIDFLYNNQNNILTINNINVYNIETLAQFKANAFLDRYSARDIFDVSFLLSSHPMSITNNTALKIYNKMNSLGIDYMENTLKNDDVLKNCDYAEILLSMDNNLKKRFPNGIISPEAKIDNKPTKKKKLDDPPIGY
jgi:predicted nucleotidyltransferase component of viral defense system